MIARYECLNHFKAFMTRPTVEVGLLIGGEQVSAANQKRIIENSHIIVATPSRPSFTKIPQRPIFGKHKETKCEIVKSLVFHSGRSG